MAAIGRTVMISINVAVETQSLTLGSLILKSKIKYSMKYFNEINIKLYAHKTSDELMTSELVRYILLQRISN